VGTLLQACTEAVATLRKNLTCGKPSAENRAAATILEQATRGVELLDLCERVEQLEIRAEGK
jgi:hypothetical protein